VTAAFTALVARRFKAYDNCVTKAVGVSHRRGSLPQETKAFHRSLEDRDSRARPE